MGVACHAAAAVVPYATSVYGQSNAKRSQWLQRPDAGIPRKWPVCGRGDRTYHPVVPGVAAQIDAVVVSYNSRATLRACVESLLAVPAVHVIVVDNASQDDALGTLDGLQADLLPESTNGGFARGCNVGSRHGSAPYVLLLNPDAVIDQAGLERLVTVLAEDPHVGLAGPRIVDADGRLEFSQRNFPGVRSAFAQALFLHRVFPRAEWTDQLIRNRARYEEAGSAPWVSGACMLIRREALEAVEGLDEGFFLYGEDIDLCRRLRDAGYEIRFEPSATVTHIGGISAPRTDLLPVLAASRLRYAKKHMSRLEAVLIRVGVALSALTHALVGRGGASARQGHAQAFRQVWSA